MFPTIPQTLIFNEFIDWYPENSRFQLIDRIIVEIQPNGKHQEITNFSRIKPNCRTNFISIPKKIPSSGD
ncbi:MAG: hypothetical protein N3E45_14680 [Oscillatoriaceae bacterium SKW80]|nr:hypothetical protein [Oscillatoriaceae bacterium SKYG93]MCX8122043.1 hypothetical protein [Oscillatoriaceae bacterium SKW80]MDW8454330.1 hypothetical protein [Oscillatoriaceae cyanobacterium SKYGB_i_bin93]HIK29194.1 hypothetical protein [Oscillatoriaceae cyanobacterium M7585_C2015_266]